MLNPQPLAPLAATTQPDAALPAAIIGAGPVGLAAAAHLLERGIEPLLLEAGASVGQHLLDYGHVQLFSPWRYDIDAAMARALQRSGGWQRPDDDALPTAADVVHRLLRPYAALDAVRSRLRLSTRVLAISRDGFDKVSTAGRDGAAFVLRVAGPDGSQELRARAVIDASGTWSRPNPLGANGLPANGEAQHAAAIDYGIPDVLGARRADFAGARTLVVGAGHSAANVLLALAELARREPGTRIVWAVRSPRLARVFGGGEGDALAARGALGTALRRLLDSGAIEFVAGLRIAGVARGSDGRLVVEGRGPAGSTLRVGAIDRIVCATGQRPDLSLAAELRLKLDPWLESVEALGPLIDPNLHSCGTVRPHGHRELAHPESGFYTLGVKSYGRAPTFLMATGYEQARSVAAAIAGDIEAADRVELDLPQTGVCSVGSAGATGAAADAGCCGGPPQADASACCALDERKKAQGESGCGCAGGPAPAAPRRSAVGCCG